MKDQPYTIDLSDEDNTMHLSKDGGPTICTDWNSAAPLQDFLKLAEDANNGINLLEAIEQIHVWLDDTSELFEDEALANIDKARELAKSILEKSKS